MLNKTDQSKRTEVVDFKYDTGHLKRQTLPAGSSEDFNIKSDQNRGDNIFDLV